MSAFVLVAALLAVAVILPLVYPLLKRGSAAPRAGLLAGLVAIAVAGGAAALYPLWSSWKWSVPEPAADSPVAMIGRLARRLENQPDDLQGWLMLGRSYAVVEQYPLAARAYQRASNLAGGRSSEALMGLGEALVNGGQSDLAGRAGHLFEQALAIDPNSVKVLLYSALAAAQRNELPLARERFQRLLDGNPPPEGRRFLEEQIQIIDAQLTLAAKGGAQPAGGPAARAAAADTVRIPLHITLAKAVADKAAPGAPLFVLARTPGQRGPPLVAKRLDARFPQDVDLLSTDAVMGGSGFTAGQEIEIEARIANGGSAISRSGDPFGTITVKAEGRNRVSVEINRLKP